MREKLLKLLKENDFISGEKLAEELNVSRTAIWKQIKNLKKIGYTIKSVENKGYKLVSNPDIPIPEEITPYLDTKIIGRKIYHYWEVTSTSDIGREKIKKDAIDGTIIVSDIQSKGRGRKDRTWISNRGGLWFSIIFYPRLLPEQGMILTMACSIAVAKAFKKIVDVNLNPEIKWPNDILINKKKVCGILTEFDAETDRINYAIVGIGINVNNNIDRTLKQTATSLKNILGKPVSKVDLLKYIIKFLDRYYLDIKACNYKKIRHKWLFYSKIIGRKIVVKRDTGTVKGIVKNIDKNGFLILDNGKEKMRILSGDISLI